jgi:hypothetical protein
MNYYAEMLRMSEDEDEEDERKRHDTRSRSLRGVRANQNQSPLFTTYQLNQGAGDIVYLWTKRKIVK